MIYYRDKYCKLFEEDSNENDNLDNTNNSSDNIQLKTIDITSRDIKNNFQNLLQLSKDKLNSVISIAKLRFEDNLDDTEDKNSTESYLTDDKKIEQTAEKEENNVILNVMSSMDDIKKMVLDLLSTAIKLTDLLLNIKNTQDDIKDNLRSQTYNLLDILDKLRKNLYKLDLMEYNLDIHNKKLDLIRLRQDPDIKII